MPQDYGGYGYVWGNSNNGGNGGENYNSGDVNGDNDPTWSCCNDSQTLFILLYIAFIGLALITWNTLLAKPMRLIAVFIHEWSHATACWFSGGSVLNIEVYDNEGGVTRFMGGCRSLIIPAGYVGCSFWAMIFVILSGGRKTATFAAIIFSISLVVALCYSPNRVLVYLCLAYTILTVGVTIVEYKVYSPILQFLILFYGVFVGIYAIEDIYEDTIVREVQGSDAYACHKEVCTCCVPRCVGLQWAILAIAFQLCGIWIALVQMSEECDDLSWFKCMSLSVDLDDLDDLTERHWDFDGWWHQQGFDETVNFNSDQSYFNNGGH